jgi:hypothetical protein
MIATNGPACSGSGVRNIFGPGGERIAVLATPPVKAAQCVIGNSTVE